MIDFKEFNQYLLSERFELINHKGKYLGVREQSNHYVALYDVEDTFIEVSYFPTQYKIAEIEILDDDAVLDLYIDYMITLTKERS